MSIQSTNPTSAIQEVSGACTTRNDENVQSLKEPDAAFFIPDPIFPLLPLTSSTAALPKCEAETGNRKHLRHYLSLGNLSDIRSSYFHSEMRASKPKS